MTGKEQFSSTTTTVFAKLTDIGFLAACIPNARILESQPERAVWTLAPKLPFLSGELHTTCLLTAAQPAEQASYTLDIRGLGSNAHAEATLIFHTDNGTDTVVEWQATITQLGGMLKLAPPGMIDVLAKKIIAEAWVEIRKRLDSACTNEAVG